MSKGVCLAQLAQETKMSLDDDLKIQQCDDKAEPDDNLDQSHGAGNGAGEPGKQEKTPMVGDNMEEDNNSFRKKNNQQADNQRQQQESPNAVHEDMTGINGIEPTIVVKPKFKEKRPVPLKLTKTSSSNATSRTNQDTPLDLSTKTPGSCAMMSNSSLFTVHNNQNNLNNSNSSQIQDGPTIPSTGSLSSLPSGGPLETPRILWQEPYDMVLQKMRLYSASSGSSSQNPFARLHHSTSSFTLGTEQLATPLTPITPNTPSRSSSMMNKCDINRNGALLDTIWSAKTGPLSAGFHSESGDIGLPLSAASRSNGHSPLFACMPSLGSQKSIPIKTNHIQSNDSSKTANQNNDNCLWPSPNGLSSFPGMGRSCSSDNIMSLLNSPLFQHHMQQNALDLQELSPSLMTSGNQSKNNQQIDGLINRMMASRGQQQQTPNYNNNVPSPVFANLPQSASLGPMAGCHSASSASVNERFLYPNCHDPNSRQINNSQHSNDEQQQKLMSNNPGNTSTSAASATANLLSNIHIYSPTGSNHSGASPKTTPTSTSATPTVATTTTSNTTMSNIFTNWPTNSSAPAPLHNQYMSAGDLAATAQLRSPMAGIPNQRQFARQTGNLAHIPITPIQSSPHGTNLSNMSSSLHTPKLLSPMFTNMPGMPTPPSASAFDIWGHEFRFPATNLGEQHHFLSSDQLYSPLGAKINISPKLIAQNKSHQTTTTTTATAPMANSGAMHKPTDKVNVNENKNINKAASSDVKCQANEARDTPASGAPDLNQNQHGRHSSDKTQPIIREKQAADFSQLITRSRDKTTTTPTVKSRAAFKGESARSPPYRLMELDGGIGEQLQEMTQKTQDANTSSKNNRADGGNDNSNNNREDDPNNWPTPGPTRVRQTCKSSVREPAGNYSSASAERPDCISGYLPERSASAIPTIFVSSAASQPPLRPVNSHCSTSNRQPLPNNGEGNASDGTNRKPESSAQNVNKRRTICESVNLQDGQRDQSSSAPPQFRELGAGADNSAPQMEIEQQPLPSQLNTHNVSPHQQPPSKISSPLCLDTGTSTSIARATPSGHPDLGSSSSTYVSRCNSRQSDCATTTTSVSPAISLVSNVTPFNAGPGFRSNSAEPLAIATRNKTSTERVCRQNSPNNENTTGIRSRSSCEVQHQHQKEQQLARNCSSNQLIQPQYLNTQSVQHLPQAVNQQPQHNLTYNITINNVNSVNANDNNIYSYSSVNAVNTLAPVQHCLAGNQESAFQFSRSQPHLARQQYATQEQTITKVGYHSSTSNNNASTGNITSSINWAPPAYTCQANSIGTLQHSNQPMDNSCTSYHQLLNQNTSARLDTDPISNPFGDSGNSVMMSNGHQQSSSNLIGPPSNSTCRQLSGSNTSVNSSDINLNHLRQQQNISLNSMGDLSRSPRADGCPASGLVRNNESSHRSYNQSASHQHQQLNSGPVGWQAPSSGYPQNQQYVSNDQQSILMAETQSDSTQTTILSPLDSVGTSLFSGQDSSTMIRQQHRQHQHQQHQQHLIGDNKTQQQNQSGLVSRNPKRSNSKEGPNSNRYEEQQPNLIARLHSLASSAGDPANQATPNAGPPLTGAAVFHKRLPGRQAGGTLLHQHSNKFSHHPRRYHCDSCQKSFTRSDMLTRHRRLHSGDKPFGCAHCNQTFSRSDHLQTHMRTHTGQKPYKCNICKYTACRKDMITRHMRTHNRSGT